MEEGLAVESNRTAACGGDGGGRGSSGRRVKNEKTCEAEMTNVAWTRAGWFEEDEHGVWRWLVRAMLGRQRAIRCLRYEVDTYWTSIPTR